MKEIQYQSGINITQDLFQKNYTQNNFYFPQNTNTNINNNNNCSTRNTHNTHNTHNTKNTQNIFIMNLINPFQQESLRHIDPYIVIDAIFNSQDKKCSENDAYHTLDVFTRIHQELIKDSRNMNIYIKGFRSKHVTYLNRNLKFENNSVENAIFARVKRIYEETLDIYENIRYTTPSIFIDIYEKYQDLIEFNFMKMDFNAMLKYLSDTLTQLFELYKKNSFIKHKQETDMIDNFKLHWFETNSQVVNHFDRVGDYMLQIPLIK